MAAGTELLDAKKILKKLGVKRGNCLVDFGIGTSGNFSLAASRLVGDEGRIYSVDIIPDIIKMFKKRCALEGICNVRTIWGDFEGETRSLDIENDVADFVISIHNLWCTKDLTKMAKEAKRILAPHGKLIIIDWKPEMPHPVSPSANACTSVYDAKRRLMNCGFAHVEETPIDRHHWGLVFRLA